MNKIMIGILLVFLSIGPVQAEKGDAWYEVSPVAAEGSSGFDVEIYVDAQGSTLSAYQFMLTYEPSDGIVVDTSKGRYGGVSVGPDGFVIAVNPNNPGKVLVNGFDVAGVPGKEQMHVITVHFSGYADDAGSLKLSVETLADSRGEPIR